MKSTVFAVMLRGDIREELKASSSAFDHSFRTGPFMKMRLLLAVFLVFTVFGVG